MLKTTSGKYVSLDDFRKEDVSIRDIAISLSRITRFNGHGVVEGLSVLQHSMLVSRILEDQGYDALTQLLGLIHDCHEAYLGDLVPAQAEFYEVNNDRIDDFVSDLRFFLLPHHSIFDYRPVKKADSIALDLERRVMWPASEEREDMYWNVPGDLRIPLDKAFKEFYRAKNDKLGAFLTRYFHLYDYTCERKQ